MFPLESVLLPGEALPLRIFEPRYTALVADCLAAAEPEFGAVLIARGREVGGDDVRSDVGTRARITRHLDLGAGRYELLAQIGQRLRVLRWLPDDPYPRAVVQPWPDEPGPTVSDERISQVVDAILVLAERVATLRGGRLRPDALAVDPDTADDPGRHLYALASRVPMGQADRYAVLCAPTLAARVDVLLDAVATLTAIVDFQLSGD